MNPAVSVHHLPKQMPQLKLSNPQPLLRSLGFVSEVPCGNCRFLNRCRNLALLRITGLQRAGFPDFLCQGHEAFGSSVTTYQATPMDKSVKHKIIVVASIGFNESREQRFRARI